MYHMSIILYNIELFQLILEALRLMISHWKTLTPSRAISSCAQNYVLIKTAHFNVCHQPAVELVKSCYFVFKNQHGRCSFVDKTNRILSSYPGILPSQGILPALIRAYATNQQLDKLMLVQFNCLSPHTWLNTTVTLFVWYEPGS